MNQTTGSCTPSGKKPARKPISTSQRFAVFNRDHFSCVYCGRRPPEVRLHVDHVTPVSQGGSNGIDNLRTACDRCNLGKGARVANSPDGKTRPPAVHPLVGRGFLSFIGNDVNYQGEIVEYIEAPEPLVIVSYFSWIMGEYTHDAMMRVKDFLGDGNTTYKLFANGEERNEYCRSRNIPASSR